MTCQFYYITTRPFCALGEPDGRHCGPRQYPPGPCNLDEDGNGTPGGLAYAMDGDQVRFRPGPDESHGVYEAPLMALWRLFAGLDVFPVELVEVTA